MKKSDLRDKIFIKRKSDGVVCQVFYLPHHDEFFVKINRDDDAIKIAGDECEKWTTNLYGNDGQKKRLDKNHYLKRIAVSLEKIEGHLGNIADLKLEEHNNNR